MLNLYEAFLMTSIAVGVIAALLAKAKGRDPVRWFAIGAALNVLGLIIVMLVENRQPDRNRTATARI